VTTSPPNAAASTFEVFEVLSRSRAQLERAAPLGDALLLAQWHNTQDSPRYQRPQHHTLSVYLEGGQGTRLAGQAGASGAPGRYCVLPAGHESHWQVDAPFRFLHLYVSPDAWADRVVRLLDAEPRTHTLELAIFGEDEGLARWARAVNRLDWRNPGARLGANALSHEVLDALVLRTARPGVRAAALRPSGGLSAAARRRVLEHIEAGLDGAEGALGLGRLAALAHLSEFHFARMFKRSMGLSVGRWILQRRMARAQRLLIHSVRPLADLALDCGWGSASHFSQVFKQQLGVTPMQYRRLTSSAT
jgi:AraC family transcriptional regulator